MSRRTERVGDLLLEVLSELVLRDVKDPRVGSVTLTGVDVSPDMQNAQVRFCTLGGEVEGRKRAQAGLASASAFLQGKAGKMLRMKRTPKLHFAYDEGFDHAADIHRLLRSVEPLQESAPDDTAGKPSDEEE